MFELIKQIGFTLALIFLIPVIIIDMKLHPEKWDDFYGDDPMGDPDNPFYYR